MCIELDFGFSLRTPMQTYYKKKRAIKTGSECAGIGELWTSYNLDPTSRCLFLCRQPQLAKFCLLPGPISLTVLQRFSALLAAATAKTTNNLQVKLRKQKQLQQQLNENACTRFVVFSAKQKSNRNKQTTKT